MAELNIRSYNDIKYILEKNCDIHGIQNLKIHENLNGLKKENGYYILPRIPSNIDDHLLLKLINKMPELEYLNITSIDVSMHMFEVIASNLKQFKSVTFLSFNTWYEQKYEYVDYYETEIFRTLVRMDDGVTIPKLEYLCVNLSGLPLTFMLSENCYFLFKLLNKSLKYLNFYHIRYPDNNIINWFERTKLNLVELKILMPYKINTLNYILGNYRRNVYSNHYSKTLKKFYYEERNRNPLIAGGNFILDLSNMLNLEVCKFLI